LGLVSGRLADELARPVAAASLVESEVRGSVRATADFDVALGLAAVGDHLLKRGGHAAAGGFSASPAAWDAFVAAFEALPRPFPADAAVSLTTPDELPVDLVLAARYLGWPLLAELERLMPFGPGHPEPMLAVTGLIVGDARRVGAGANHLSLLLRRGAETIDAIAFGVDDERETPEPGTAIDVVATLESRTFDGEPRLQLRVVDYATTDASPLLGRRRMTPTPVPDAEPLAVA
jgi:single-stranded-DNA-specific exonuclease